MSYVLAIFTAIKNIKVILEIIIKAEKILDERKRAKRIKDRQEAIDRLGEAKTPQEQEDAFKDVIGTFPNN